MKATNINQAWVYELDKIIRFGQTASPRSMDTLEILLSTIKIDMSHPVLTIPRRRLGYHFLAAEAAWILSGDNRLETIEPYAPAIAEFSDDGKTFFGAYGPRIMLQVDHVINALKKDPSTRQAVINIWRENPPASRDIPCTPSCQVLIRDDRLHMFVTMRSSDIWLGVPYDLFNFTMLAGYILLETRLDVQLGHLYNTATSRHLYKKNLSDAIAAAAEREDQLFEYRPFDPNEFRAGRDLVDYLWRHAEGTAAPSEWLSEAYTK